MGKVTIISTIFYFTILSSILASEFTVQSNSRKAAHVKLQIIHEVNSNQINALKLLKYTRNKKTLISSDIFTLEQCQEGPITLLDKFMIIILSLECSHLDAKLGGEIKLKYLYDFHRSEYRNQRFKMVQSGNGTNWYLSDNKKISRTIKVLVNNNGGKEIGIKSIKLK